MAVEKEDIVQYVQETPGNSNPAVLRSLLNQLEDSGEGATFKVEKEDDEKSYQSVYTGAEIDAAVAKAGTVSAVEANPTLTGTEVALTGLQVGETKYKVGSGGSELYRHRIDVNYSSNIYHGSIITNNSEPFTLDTFKQYLSDNGTGEVGYESIDTIAYFSDITTKTTGFLYLTRFSLTKSSTGLKAAVAEVSYTSEEGLKVQPASLPYVNWTSDTVTRFN